MQETITEAIRNPSFFTYIAVFLAGMLISLGSCAVLEVPILIGYLGGVKTKSRSRLFAITALFVLGMLVTYFLIGIFIGLVATALTRLIIWSKVLYIILGLVSIIIGLVLLGLFKLPIPEVSTLSNFKGGKGDLIGAFFLGFGFVFLEAPTCPACAPALVVISAYMVTQQKILYGLALLLVYVFGQSIPILLIGLFTGYIKQITERFHSWSEYIQIVAGILLIVVGLDLLWLA